MNLALVSIAFQMNLFQVAFQFQVERYYNVAMDYDLTGAFQLDSLMNISCNNKCLNLCFDECQQTLICSSLTYSKANKTCKLFNKNVDLANDAVQKSGSDQGCSKASDCQTLFCKQIS
jgi:hypothetical protein